jgi:hypothetical protein
MAKAATPLPARPTGMVFPRAAEFTVKDVLRWVNTWRENHNIGSGEDHPYEFIMTTEQLSFAEQTHMIDWVPGKVFWVPYLLGREITAMTAERIQKLWPRNDGLRPA